eukprot:1666836-Prymnesium_polylepis.1
MPLLTAHFIIDASPSRANTSPRGLHGLHSSRMLHFFPCIQTDCRAFVSTFVGGTKPVSASASTGTTSSPIRFTSLAKPPYSGAGTRHVSPGSDSPNAMYSRVPVAPGVIRIQLGSIGLLIRSSLYSRVRKCATPCFSTPAPPPPSVYELTDTYGYLACISRSWKDVGARWLHARVNLMLPRGLSGLHGGMDGFRLFFGTDTDLTARFERVSCCSSGFWLRNARKHDTAAWHHASGVEACCALGRYSMSGSRHAPSRSTRGRSGEGEALAYDRVLGGARRQRAHFWGRN